MDWFCLIVLFIFLAVITGVVIYSESGFYRNRLRKKKFAKSNAVIVSISNRRCGYKRHNYNDIVVHFSDGTSYQCRQADYSINKVYDVHRKAVIDNGLKFFDKIKIHIKAIKDSCMKAFDKMKMIFSQNTKNHRSTTDNKTSFSICESQIVGIMDFISVLSEESAKGYENDNIRYLDSEIVLFLNRLQFSVNSFNEYEQKILIGLLFKLIEKLSLSSNSVSSIILQAYFSEEAKVISDFILKYKYR